MTAPTLHEALAARGLRAEAERCRCYERRIMRVADGAVVFTGDAAAVWAWIGAGMPAPEARP